MLITTFSSLELSIRTINKLIKERNKLQQLDDEGQRQNMEQGQPGQDIEEQPQDIIEQPQDGEEITVDEGTNEETDRHNVTHPTIMNNVNFDSPRQ